MARASRNTSSATEVTLPEFARQLWAYKLPIVAVAIATWFVAGLVWFYVKDFYTVSIFVGPVSSQEINRYYYLNSFKYEEIDKGKLISLFAEDLSSRKTLEESIIKNRYVVRAENQSDEDFSREVTKSAYGFSVPAARASGLTISVKTSQAGKARQVLVEALERSNENTREILGARFQQKIDQAKRDSDFQIANARAAIENALEDYDKDMRNRLAFLQEQAAMARALDMAKPALDVNPFNVSAYVVANVNSDSPFYLRGFEIIEKEIELIQNRKAREPFISVLPHLENKLRAAMQDKTIERVQQALEKSPLKAGEFRAVDYELTSLTATPQYPPLLMLFLAVLASVFLSLAAGTFLTTWGNYKAGR